jgi:diguanylate cyclase (GGDEF)-like protein/PAS domain S-box-containing protein
MLTGAMSTVGVDEPSMSPSSKPARRRYVIGSVALAVAGVASVLLRGGSLDHGVTAGLILIFGIAIVVNQAAVSAEVAALMATNDESLNRLRVSEERFRTAFDGAPVGIAIIEQGLFQDVNPALQQFLGRTRDELVGAHFREIIGADELPLATEDDWKVLTETTSTRSTEVPLHQADGTTSWYSVTVARNPDLSVRRAIAIVEDITERRATRQRLAHLAIYDQLTGLPNRRSFMEALGNSLAATSGRGVGVAFLDLDRFKVINDSLGHAVGDKMLVVLAKRISDAVGDHGIAARFAGDEFTILLPDIDRADAAVVLDGVQDALGVPIHLGDGVTDHPTASIGIAWFPPGHGDPETALARADAAMYRAKAKGRNLIEFFDIATDDAASQLRIFSELHSALERQEFRAFYQPLIELDTGRTVGFEALVRWQHPRLGLLEPSAFIEAAEESGLIVEVGEWMLREALGQLATWQRQFPGQRLTISVNLAARQISEPFVEVLTDVLAVTGIDPTLVWLEITETALMVDIRMAESVLGRLRQMGVHLTVDDFGTGYSSLTYLSRFPVEGLKIDRSFTEGLGHDPQADAICEGVTSLGNALGLRCVAEGIERPEQWEAMRAVGCPYGQGYLFGRPAPVEVAATYVERVADVGALTPAPTR